MNTGFRRIIAASIMMLALTILGPNLSSISNIAAAASSGLTWKRNLTEGMAAAKASKKWILVDVYTPWCGWCDKLDRDTYTNPNVIQFLNKSFVPVKVNGDDPELGKYVKSRYGINSYPSILVLLPNGNLLGKFSGYKEPRGFISAVSRLISR